MARAQHSANMHLWVEPTTKGSGSLLIPSLAIISKHIQLRVNTYTG